MAGKVYEVNKSTSSKSNTPLPQIAQAKDADLTGRATPIRRERDNRDIMELQQNAVKSQMDKFKNSLREKDMIIQSLKQENMVLKQVNI
jgi:hypothetical protein